MAVPLFLLTFLSTAFCQDIRFLAVGDWGGQSDAPYTTPVQLQVAAQMGKTAASFGSQFTLGIGDNFYDSGIDGSDLSARFNETFSSVYTAPALQTRWYFVAGNHDHKGNVTAQIDHSKDDPRWYFPNYYYTETLPIGASGETVQLVFFDSVVFTDLLTPEAVRQHRWIEATLAGSKATWLFVVAHYPVYSVAEHGPTPELVDFLLPLLSKYHVDAYFSGHDHNLQHLQHSSIDFVVTGAGHGTDDSTEHSSDVPAGALKFHWPSQTVEHGGFVSVAVNATTLSVDYIDDEGNVLYTFSKLQSRE